MQLNLISASKEQKYSISIILLRIAIFTSPLRSYGLFTYRGYNGSIFKISTVFLFFVLIFSNKNLWIKKSVSITIVFLIFVYNIASLLYSSESLGYFPSYFFSFFFLTVGLITIYNNRNSYFTLIKSFIYSIFIPGLIGVYQWIHYSLTGVLVNLPFAKFAIADARYIFLYDVNRISSTLLDPSYYGMFAAMIFIVSIGILINKNIFGKIYNRRFFIICVFAAMISLFSLIITVSVSSFINVITGSIILLLITVSLNKHGASVSRNVKSLVILLGISSAVLIYIYFVFRFDIFSIVLRKINFQSSSNSVGKLFGRFTHFSQALNEFSNSPIWGVGFGNLEMTSGHNSFLTILAQQGLIGLILHFTLLVAIPISVAVNINNITNLKPDKFMYLIIFSAFMGTIIQSLAYDCLYKMDPTSVLVLLVIVGGDILNKPSLVCHERRKL